MPTSFPDVPNPIHSEENAMSDNNDNSLSVLTSQLLCASNASYGIGFAGEPDFVEQQPYYGRIGWIDDPSHFVSASRDHACLVGTLHDPVADEPAVVLAFRGTHPPQVDNIQDAASFFRDWVNDVRAVPKPVPGLGDVHEGFWDAVDALWTQALLDEVERRLQQCPSRRLHVTGHSKGGAMAYLAAARLHREARPVTAVHTFAAARAGTDSFAEIYNQAGIPSARYEFGDDLVPHLPPSELLRDTIHHELSALSGGGFKLLSGLAKTVKAQPPVLSALGEVIAGLDRFEYVSVGELRYINRQLHIQGDSPALERQRLVSLFIKLVTPGGFVTVATDHSIACGSGYGRALLAKGVCG
ncbi:MAG: lipase family protein [Methylococcaceae bacterium]|nr:lipase family protein [Methylococcaceae bacterium]